MITIVISKDTQNKKDAKCDIKNIKHGGRVKKLSIGMRSNLSFNQLKIDYSRYKLLHVSLMVATKEKPVANIEKIKKKKYKHTAKERHHTTKD